MLRKIDNGELDIRVKTDAIGMWTITNKNFKTDYVADAAKSGYYHAIPGTGRLCLPANGEFNMLTQWGSFNVRNGGVVAIRYADVPGLAAAIHDVEIGKIGIEEALYTVDAKGNKVARFDVYGMDPGFYEANYELTRLPARIRNARRTLGVNSNSPQL